MKYQYTNKEVTKGDYCIFVWIAEPFSDEINDAPVSKPGEKTYGKWTDGDYGSICNIPVIVEEVTDEYVEIRPFKFTKDGKSCEYIYTEGHSEPISFQFKNRDEIFPRLIKSQWAVPSNFDKQLDELAEEYYESEDCEWTDTEEEQVKAAYKAGYKKAKNIL